jgi:hypothetical protein
VLLLIPGEGEAMLDGIGCALEGFNDSPSRLHVTVCVTVTIGSGSSQ